MKNPEYVGRHQLRTIRGRLFFLLCAAVVFAVDQISKYAVVSHMVIYETIPVIGGFFHLTYIINYGASFGMLQHQAGLFIGLSILVLLFICWTVFFWTGIDRTTRILLGVVAGGALGNLVDRLRYGSVVDFLDFQGIWSYIFNAADMAVVCGGLILAYMIIMGGGAREKRKPKH